MFAYLGLDFIFLYFNTIESDEKQEILPLIFFSPNFRSALCVLKKVIKTGWNMEIRRKYRKRERTTKISA